MIPLVHTLAIAAASALLGWVGYGAASSAVWALYDTLFNRAAYRARRSAWQALRTARLALADISAQDQFARWARQQREVDKLQAAWGELDASGKRTRALRDTALSLAMRVLANCAVALWLWRARRAQCAAMAAPEHILGPISRYLSYPSAPEGSVSCIVLFVLSSVAFRRVLECL